MIYTALNHRYIKSIIYRPDMTHTEFAETHVILKGTKVSPFPGRLNLARSPHLRKLFELYDRIDIRQIWLKWASQTGKTLALSIPAAKAIYSDGGFIHWIYPVKDKVGDLIRLKFDPTMKSIPIVWSMFEDYKAVEKIRDKRTFKETANGGVYITGVTANDLKSVSVPFTIGDEIGEMPKGTMTEAEERQKSFTRVFPRTIGASTIVAPDDEINIGYDSAECKLEYHFICPRCTLIFDDHRDKLKFISKEAYTKKYKINIEEIEEQKYLKEAIEAGHIECPHCQREIYEKEREKMLYDGKGATWVVVEGDEKTAKSFGLSMGSLTAWFVTIESTIRAVVKAEGNPEAMDKVLRNWFNEFPKHTEETADSADLWLLDSGTPELEVPDDTYKLFMSVDNQKNRVYVVIDAFTYSNNQITILAEEIMAHGGNDWDSVKNLFKSLYYDKDGEAYNISTLCIDFRGYSDKDINRITEAKECVKELLVYMREHNIQDQEVFGIYGVDNIKDDRPFTLPRRTTKIGDENYKIPIMNMNNRVIKMSMYMDTEHIRGRIPRTIAKIKDSNGEHTPVDEWDNPSEYTTGLYFINSTIIEKEKEFVKKRDKLTNNAFTKHLTAEVYNPIEKIYENPFGRRNDYSDCILMNLTASIKSEVSQAQRPDEYEGERAFELLKGFNKR